MNKNIKLTPNEVLEMLEDGQSYTKQELSAHFDCHPKTIAKKVKTLRKDGSPIISNNNGYLLIDKVRLESLEVAEASEEYIDWISASIGGIVTAARPIKKYLPQVKRTLRVTYTPDERKEIIRTCARITNLLIHAQEEEF